MEFKITNPIDESGYLKSIDFNFDEMKAELSANLEKYKNLVFTEDKTKEAKADRAKLNKLKEAIENKRKEVKKLCLQPYEGFELKVKELVALIDEPILQIDTAVKSFEKKKKDDKKKLLKEYFGNFPKDNEVAEFVTFEDFIEPREQLLNASYNLNNAYAEIEAWLTKILEHLCILKSQSESLHIDYTILKMEYKKSNFDFAKVVEFGTKYDSERKKATSNIQPHLQLSPPNQTAQKTKRIEFYVEVTSEQARAIQTFFKENGIKYGAIK